MLYVFHGSDVVRSVKKAKSLAASLMAKRPDAAFEQINADSFSRDILQSHLGGQGLFSQRYIIFLDRLTENEIGFDALVEFSQPLNESANVFIVVEGVIKVELRKAFEKHASKIVVTEEKGKSFRPAADVFALADAVAAKNSFKAWSLFRESIDNGIAPENILGTLFWKIKSVLLAAQARKISSNYSQQELKNLLQKLVRTYHEGHRGTIDMEMELEKMMLSS